MSVPCKHDEDNSGFRYCIQKQPKLELEKGIDYEEKKEQDRQIQEDILCTFKKRFY